MNDSKNNSRNPDAEKLEKKLNSSEGSDDKSKNNKIVSPSKKPEQKQSQSKAQSSEDKPAEKPKVLTYEQQLSEIAAKLKQGRETRNWTINDVSDRLKIPLHILTAIEDANVKELPEQVFIKGFIRSYANLCGIDSKQVELQNQQKSTEEFEPKPQKAGRVSINELRNLGMLNQEGSTFQPKSKGRGRRVGYFFAILILLAAGAFVIWFVSSSQKLTSDTDEITENNSFEVTYDNEFSSIEVDFFDETPASTDNNSIATDINESNPANLPNNKTLDDLPLVSNFDANPKDSNDSNFIEGNLSIIEINVTDTSWIEILDGDQKSIYEKLTNIGENLVLQGKEPFIVRLGNAPGINLSFNGEKIDIKKFTRTSTKVAEITLPLTP